MAWNTRSIFISSTFADMQAERDHLRTHVFPALEERLRSRRHNLEWVDLRTGVATASLAEGEARELHVLKVCLSEVRRCRPFLIVLLGDRYGWVPPHERITAAANEEGFETDVIGRSVTDLEISFGVLDDPAQQPRSFFYFREPLPYEEMPPEQGALHADFRAFDAEARTRAERLDLLKRRIETALPERVRRYAVGWDRSRQRVTGLDAWGRQVLEDIWAELDAETTADTAKPEPSWQQEERNALEDYVEDRTRGFVGRQTIIAHLAEHATSPDRDDAPWGVCVTGTPGSGKSALFSELLRRLRLARTVVLAHAAGASLRSASVESMLRRWIDELAAVLGVPSALAENADSETIEAAFRILLGRAAADQRVVLVVDGLDQFEATPQGRHVSWLPHTLTANVRFIATAIPGATTKSLGQRHGLRLDPLDPLDAAEARTIAEGISARYHRTLEPEVLEALLAKYGPGGPAWGNPLWLVLAVEELHLLDADDFTRATRSYGGAPAEQLRALFLDIVAEMPPDIPGLYVANFVRAGEVFGQFLARAFVGFIAVSRAGWRESDFRSLLPRLSGEVWDELHFASLRRLFRGQLRRHGASGQWNFGHAQMREAASHYLAAESVTFGEFHTEAAEHLLELPRDDPLRQSETMVHLIGSEDWKSAARFYGDHHASEGELNGATQVLADIIIVGRRPDLVLQLLGAGLDSELCGALSERLMFRLDDGILSYRAQLSDRAWLADGVRRALESLAKAELNNASLQRNLGISNLKLGEVFRAQGDLAQALAAMGNGQEIFGQLAKSDPGNGMWDYYLGIASQNIGRVLMVQGDLGAATNSYRASHAIFFDLTDAAPSNVDFRHHLGISSMGIGDALVAQGDLEGSVKAFKSSHDISASLIKSGHGDSLWHHNLGVTHIRIGDVQLLAGSLPAALQAYKAALAVADQLAATDPGNAVWQRALGVAHNRIGDALVAQGRLPEAIDTYGVARSIFDRLASTDAGNSVWQRDLSLTHEKIGNMLSAQGNPPEGLEAYRYSLAMRERLAQADPTNTEWQRDLGTSHAKIGDVLLSQRDLPAALEAFRTAHAIFLRLVAADPANADWQHDRGSSHGKIGHILVEQRDQPAALEVFHNGQAIFDRLATGDPRNASYQRHLSAAIVNIGAVRLEQGDLSAALENFHAAIANFERLMRADPDNVVWQHELGDFHNTIGDNLRARGHLLEALAAYKASLAVFEQGAKSEPGNAHRLWNLLLSCQRIGDLWAEQGHLEAALQAYGTAWSSVDRLAKSDPSNNTWQRGLDRLYSVAGNILKEQGKLPEALRCFKASLEIRQRLEGANVTDDKAQRDLCLLHGKVADVLVEMGSQLVVIGDNALLQEAAEQLQASYAITDRLIRTDLGNRALQHDLAAICASYIQLGDAIRQQVSDLYRNSEREVLPLAISTYREALAIAHQITEVAPADAWGYIFLSQSHIMIGNAFRRLGDLPAALDSCQASLAIRESMASRDPSDSDRLVGLAVSHCEVGSVMSAMSNTSEAVEHYRKACSIAEQLAQAAPGDESRRHFVSQLSAELQDLLQKQSVAGNG